MNVSVHKHSPQKAAGMFVDSDERSGMCERLFLAEGVASIFTLHSTRAIPK